MRNILITKKSENSVRSMKVIILIWDQSTSLALPYLRSLKSSLSEPTTVSSISTFQPLALLRIWFSGCSGRSFYLGRRSIGDLQIILKFLIVKGVS